MDQCRGRSTSIAEYRRIITMKRILVSLFVIAFAIGSFVLWKQETVFAVGDLTINWGVPSGDPIFVVANMLPGDEESRTVEVVNGASSARPVAVRGEKTSELLAFASILDFVISENGFDIYGGTTGAKTLQNFFDESVLPASIPLSIVAAGATTHFTFKATFPTSAGNEYQGAEVIFDIIFGIDSDIPAECKDIEFTGDPIFGTEGNDTIHGTRGNDLVFALEGNDTVRTFGGDDCIVGGPGNDDLRGETGDDIIFGNEGDDLVVGAVGKDLLFGGTGNDTMRGENNEDIMEGNEGNDTMTGGNGDDLMHGNSGNDTMLGENGDDDVFGDENDDNLDGGNGNDLLVGGANADRANGKNGTDTCDAEVMILCEP